MTARKPGAKRGRPRTVLSEVDAQRLVELRRQQKTLLECMDELALSDVVVQREMVRLGVAGHVCMHCGKGTPTRRLGMRRDERAPI